MGRYATVDFTFIDRSPEVLSAMGNYVTSALVQLGEVWREHCRDLTPVVTGSLIDSWHIHVESTGVGKTVGVNSYVELGVPSDYVSPPEQESKIPSEYVEYVENGGTNNKAHHMMKNSLQNYANEYKSIIESNLRGYGGSSTIMNENLIL